MKETSMKILKNKLLLFLFSLFILSAGCAKINNIPGENGSSVSSDTKGSLSNKNFAILFLQKIGLQDTAKFNSPMGVAVDSAALAMQSEDIHV